MAAVSTVPPAKARFQMLNVRLGVRIRESFSFRTTLKKQIGMFGPNGRYPDLIDDEQFRRFGAGAGQTSFVAYLECRDRFLDVREGWRAYGAPQQ
jgi:hypothetical protein